MVGRIPLRRIIETPKNLRRAVVSTTAYTARHSGVQLPRKYSSSVQSITQRSFWASLVPKPLRKGSAISTKPKSREWNPATFFIVILLFIGSMSIQMIALRNEFAAFSRRADAKVDLLKEVIGKIQNGEEVDVEGLLGTGNPEKEKEWEEVLKEIEQEDELWSHTSQKKAKRSLKGDNTTATAMESAEKADSLAVQVKPTAKSNAPRGFY